MWPGLPGIRHPKIILTRLAFILAGLSVGGTLEAQVFTAPPAFWRHRIQQMVFTSSVQNFYEGLCSGSTTVQADDEGLAWKQTSPLTVNLVGSSTTTFYSDSTCTIPITSITIATGASSASFYFVDTSVEAPTLTASATGYVAGTQNETISTNPYIWTGGGADANWTTAANWSGNAAPGSSNVALFDGTCSSNCAATINANINVAGIRLASGYSSTVTQSTGYTVTIGGTGWEQLGGSFAGGNSNITISGPYALAGGSFTSTSGTLSASGNWVVTNSPTFVANSGTLDFAAPAGTLTLSPGTVNYNNVIFNGSSEPTFTLSGTLNVLGTLTLAGTHNLNAGGFINTGTIDALGNIAATSYGMGGTATIVVAGSTNQTITGTSSATFPSLTINSSGGTVTFSGTINVGGNYIYTAGTVDATTNSSTLDFNPGYSTYTVTPGTVNYYNVTFGPSSNPSFNLSGTMTVLGTLTLSCADSSYTAEMYGGTINAFGNVTASSYGMKGTTTITVAGSSNQTVSGASTASFPSLTIDSTGGTVTLSGTINLNGNYIYTAGTVDATTNSSTLAFNGPGSTTVTVTSGSVNYYNVTFGENSNPTYNLGGGTMTVLGTLTFSEGTSYTGSLNSGTIDAYGNVTATNGGIMGSATIVIAGSSDQLISGTSTAYFPSLTIDSTGGTVTFSGTITIAGGNYIYTAGTVDATTNSSTLVLDGQSSTTFTVTPGNVNYYNVTFEGGSHVVYDLGGGTMTVLGTLTLSETTYYTGSLNSGTINAFGNVTATSGGIEGNATIVIAGSANQTVTGVSSAWFPDLTINSSGGTVTFSGTIKVFGGNYVYTAGTVDAITNSSTLAIYGESTSTFTVTPGNVSYYNVSFEGMANSAIFNLGGGTMSVHGNLVLYGGSNWVSSLNSGTINVLGNVTATTYGVAGSAALTFAGTSNQSVSSCSTCNFPTGAITINNSSGVTLASNVSWNASSQATSVTIGPIDMAGYNLTLHSLALNGNTLTKNAGTLTVGGTTAGTGSLYGGTVNP